MRNALILLSSLALASVSGAQSFGTSTATTRVSYDALPSNVRVLSLVGETYDHYADGSAGTFGSDLGGTVQLGHTQSASGSFDAATRAFDLTSTVSASLDSTDYSAVPKDTDGAYQFALYGYRYFLQLHNTSDQDASITFHVTLDHDSSGVAASPFGRLAYLPGGFTMGGYADAGPAGGIIDRSVESAFGSLPNVRSEFYATAYDTSPGVSTPTFSSVTHDGFDATYVLAKGAIHTYQIYAATSASAQYNPVPEPASLAALGFGALGLLRRRRKA